MGGANSRSQSSKGGQNKKLEHPCFTAKNLLDPNNPSYEFAKNYRFEFVACWARPLVGKPSMTAGRRFFNTLTRGLFERRVFPNTGDADHWAFIARGYKDRFTTVTILLLKPE